MTVHIEVEGHLGQIPVYKLLADTRKAEFTVCSSKRRRLAAASAGLTRFQQMRLIVLPQATRMVIPSLVGQFVLLVKDSSVVSAIGLLDLTRSGWILVQSIPNGLLAFALIGLGYFAICYPMLYLSRRLEKR